MLKKYSIKSIFSQCILPKKNFGFFLIEIMCAFAMLCGTMIIMAHFCWHIIGWQHETKAYGNAIILATQIIEKIKNTGHIQESSYAKDSFIIRCTSCPVPQIHLPLFYTAQCMSELHEVELKILWKSFNGAERMYVTNTILKLKK